MILSMCRTSNKGQVVVEFVVEFNESTKVVCDEIKAKVYGMDQKERPPW